jgi:hypothetical protein
MKKVVSIIVALFVFIGVCNAEVVTFTYSTCKSKLTSARGTASFTVSSEGVSLTCKSDYTSGLSKGIKGDGNNELVIFNATSTKQANISISVSLSSDLLANDKRIKKVRILTTGVSPLNGSTVTGVVENDLTTSTSGLYYDIENNFGDVSTVTLTNAISSNFRFVTIEVHYGTFAIGDVELSDSETYDYVGQEVYAKNVTYTRPMNSNKWGTLCVPFEFKVNDDAFAVYQISEMSDGDVLKMKKINNGYTIPAGHPVIIYCSLKNLVVKASNVVLTTEAYDENGVSSVSKVTDYTDVRYKVHGNILPISIDEGFFVSSNQFYYKDATNTREVILRPYRAYVTIDNTLSSKRKAIPRIIMEDGSEIEEIIPTAVESVEAEEAEPTVLGIFTADGRQVEELQKGLNIVKTTNGTKKIYVR